MGERWAAGTLTAALTATCLVLGAPHAPAAVASCPAEDAAHVTVTIADNSYTPTPKTVTPGTTVCWIYTTGGTHHTVTSDDGTSFNSGAATPGMTAGSVFSHAFATAGTFNYHCQVHGVAMSGVVIVPPLKPTVSGTTPASGDNNTNPTVNGTATAGITVHVFEGASGCDTELGAVTATGGNWSYALSEAQSITSGDSRTFFARATAADGTPSACSSTSASYTAGTSGPDVVFDSGPADGSTTDDPAWTFHSTTPNTSFSCSADQGARSFTDCSSQTFAPTLADGTYTFALKVYVTASPTNERIVTLSFTVQTTGPTVTQIQGPKKTKSRRPRYTITADDGSATFGCKFRAAEGFVPAVGNLCQPTSRLRPGRHTLTVHAINGVGTGPDKTKTFTILR